MIDASLNSAMAHAIADWLAGQGQAAAPAQIEHLSLSATDALWGSMARLKILPSDFMFPRRALDPERRQAERLRAKAVIGEALQTAIGKL